MREGETKRRCLACGGALRKLADFQDMPASAQDLPGEEELSGEKAITLRLCQCGRCGLVQFDTEPVPYYRDVIRAGGGSSTMRRLRFEEYRRLLLELKKTELKEPKLLEVGCGRGEFLSLWRELPLEEEGEETGALRSLLTSLKLYGIEHSERLSEEAREQGLSVRRGFLEGDVLLPEAPFDAFTQFNFLEHQPDPLSMLRAVRRNLTASGLGLVTVPSFEYILENDGYYELLRDHIAYYTKESLQRLFRDAGFETLSERIVNRDTIEIIVRSSDTAYPGGEPAAISPVDITGLKENQSLLKETIQRHISELSREGKTMALWGASHQGFTLSSSTELCGRIRYIIDSAPFKQGRYAPGSHIRIVPPSHFLSEPVDEILIAAPGYTDEIAALIRRDFGENVKILALRSKTITEYPGGKV